MLIPCSSVSNVNFEPVNAGRVVNKINPKKIMEAQSTACVAKISSVLQENVKELFVEMHIYQG